MDCVKCLWLGRHDYGDTQANRMSDSDNTDSETACESVAWRHVCLQNRHDCWLPLMRVFRRKATVIDFWQNLKVRGVVGGVIVTEENGFY